MALRKQQKKVERTVLHSLFAYLSNYIDAFHAFSFITMRVIMATLSALVLSLWLGPSVIRRLTHLKMGQPVRDDGPQSHLVKAGTPTMGGALIILSVAVATFLWADLSNRFVWVILFLTLGYGLIGGTDDYLKLKYKNSKGLSARSKLIWQVLVATVAAIALFVLKESNAETLLLFPVFKQLTLQLGWVFIPFSIFVIVGTSNSVNLTDGLDGLAILPAVLVGGAFAVIAYLTGNVKFAEYLSIPFIPGVGELTVYGAALVGAGLGFLWFNTYPAQVFMGDVGSLALGAGLAGIAVMVRQEFVLMIMGGVFVMETLSVFIQVASFKLTGKRVFRMAPIHHHFELKGWPEPRVIVRFWIITVILVLVGLATLKLR